jgi:seryl-tRNA synthetase
MIDLQLLRNPGFVEQLQNAAKSKRMDFDAYQLAASYDERRRLAGALDSTRAGGQKALSAQFRDADAAARAALSDEMSELSAEIKTLRTELADAETGLTDLALRAPSIPDLRAPIGSSDADNEVIKHVGSR